jgi:hypothetical protein
VAGVDQMHLADDRDQWLSQCSVIFSDYFTFATKEIT